MSCEIPCDWLSVKSEEVYKSLADDPDLFGLGWQANDLTDRLQSLDTAAKASAEILRHRKPKVEVCSAKEEIEGWWNPANNTIYVNQLLVASSSCGPALSAILHCCFYVLVTDVVTNPEGYPEISTEQRQEWEDGRTTKRSAAPGIPKHCRYEFFPNLQEGRGRQQHYRTAHFYLPQIFLSAGVNADRFFILLGLGRKDFLMDSWDSVGDGLPLEELVPGLGLNCELYQLDDTRYVTLFTFPTPEEPSEAFMTALVFPMDFRTSQKIDARYFTLEAGLSPLSASREPYALVGEWVVRHESISHLNHGRVGDPTERSLVYKVREILDSQARAANH